jgi:oligopeptide/dipeptide ABC transporter ATP-binding protein
MSPMLELRDVEMHFPRKSAFLQRTIGHVRAVDGVSLTLEHGETLGLVGESGSGKSTLGRIALGLMRPTRGSVLVDGTDLASLRGRRLVALRRKLQFVFQDPYSSLDPYTPVGESVAEPLRTHGVVDGASARHARVGELLEKVGLRPAVAERYPREFSGGQLQRIAIARALALDPELIVLDEPVSSLDVSTQAEVVNLLSDLQADTGVAYLFIAHDLAVVDHLSTHIGVMYLGQVVERGETRAVVDAPKHPYTLALLSAVPGHAEPGRDKRQRIILRGDLPSPTRKVEGCRFHTRCPFVMDVCRTVDPPAFTAPDGSVATCHLHTEGPVLQGRSVAELPIPEGAEQAVPIAT